MFSKVNFISLAVGVLSVNALVIPVPRFPAPEPESLSQRGQDARNFYADEYNTRDFLPELSRFKRDTYPVRDIKPMPRPPSHHDPYWGS